MEGVTCDIFSLPDEIIIMILKRTSYADCNNFMKTCKRYNDLRKSSHSLWKVIYQKTVGDFIHDKTSSESEVNWLCNLRQYLSLRSSLIDLIVAMSPKHFSESNKDIGLENAKEIFDLALCENTSYLSSIIILQDFIHTAVKKVNTLDTKKPYTLTEIHYSKMIVRYLIHVALTVKWVHLHYTDQLTPDVVLNFFTQWLDPVKIHGDQELQDLIKDMVKDVDKSLIEASNSNRLSGVDTQDTCSTGIYTEKEVLLAISHYLYKQRRMVALSICNQDTLNIVKTIKSGSGHGACVGAIFQAIARGFGITTCNLIAFPNHLYLEWRSSKGFRPETMQFTLDRGELRTSGRCPFSANVNPHRVSSMYSPDSFIQYIISNFIAHMGDYTGWHTDNAVHLLDFLTNNHNSDYCNFILYLREREHSERSLPFNIENVHEEHKNCIYELLVLNDLPARGYKDAIVKHHTSALKYGVGLLCFHNVYDYVCVIRGWDLTYAPEFMEHPDAIPRPHAANQPFYHVTAVDQSDRYVAQENLVLVPKPSRIYHLEDAIAKEFTHFNGFFYEPNAEKQLMYPGDMAIGLMYSRLQ